MSEPRDAEDAQGAPEIVHRWQPEPVTFLDEYGDTGIVVDPEALARLMASRQRGEAA